MTAADPKLLQTPATDPQTDQQHHTSNHVDHEKAHPAELAERQRRNAVSLARAAFFIVIVTVALLTVLRTQEGGLDGSSATTILWWVPIVIAVVLYVLAVGVDILLPRKRIATISGVLFGAVAGVLATVALSAIIDLLAKTWLGDLQIEFIDNRPVYALEVFDPHLTTLKVLLGIALVYLGVSTVIQTQDDFRLVIPYVEFSRQFRGTKPLLLDSSALIDARIVDLAATGLIQAPLVIPRFVIEELQTLADSADQSKRFKGRRGLDAVSKLQRNAADVTIEDTDVPGSGADAQLVELARRNHGAIVTTDYALRRVAQIQGVTTISLHDIAAAVRPTVTAGDRIQLRIVKHGEQHGQGVGYLEDGTMVVVEHAADRIGQSPVEAEITSLMQTAAGRLVFAVRTDLHTQPPKPTPKPPPVPATSNHQHQTPTLTTPTPSTQDQTTDLQTDQQPQEPTEAEPQQNEIEPSADLAGEQHQTQDQSQQTDTNPQGPFPPKRLQRRPGNARNPRR